jgi:isopentenyl-diphosphate delta-isomerase type 1
MSDDAPIAIVNEADEPVGSALKAEAQAKGLIHRVVHIFIEDPAGKLLLQKRAADRELYPNCWDASVGGHVDAGEDYLAAAQREAFEEVGLRDLDLKELGGYRDDHMYGHRRLNRFYKVYKAVVSDDTAFTPDAEEVAELRWFTIDEIKRLIARDSSQFTEGVTEAMKRFYS